MDGGGDPIAELQSPPGPPMDAYSALVANYNPSGEVLLRMLDTGVDQFFGSANDLVVPSAGGWRIDQPGAGFIPRARIGCYGPGGNLAADSVTHVNFFARAETVDFLARALSGAPQGLRRVDPLKDTARPSAAARAAATAVAGVAPGTQAVAMPARPRARAARAGGGAATIRAAQLRVTVVNGDLTFQQAPLLLGHYRSTRLTGTERVMKT
jgi:hypothetical protein